MAPAFSSSGRRPSSTGTAALSQPGMASAVEVTIRDSSGVLGPRRSCRVVPDGSGGPDLTIAEQFALGVSLGETLNADNLRCYEMKGAPLPRNMASAAPDRRRVVWRGQCQAPYAHGPS